MLICSVVEYVASFVMEKAFSAVSWDFGPYAQARQHSLRARARGEAVSAFDTGWDRLIDRLAPGSVMINTFPRMSLMTEFMELTGEQRVWIQLPGHQAQ
jgi:hypothetical protein